MSAGSELSEQSLLGAPYSTYANNYDKAARPSAQKVFKKKPEWDDGHADYSANAPKYVNKKKPEWDDGRRDYSVSV